LSCVLHGKSHEKRKGGGEQPCREREKGLFRVIRKVPSTRGGDVSLRGKKRVGPGKEEKLGPLKKIYRTLTKGQKRGATSAPSQEFRLT